MIIITALGQPGLLAQSVSSLVRSGKVQVRLLPSQLLRVFVDVLAGRSTLVALHLQMEGAVKRGGPNAVLLSFTSQGMIRYAPDSDGFHMSVKPRNSELCLLILEADDKIDQSETLQVGNQAVTHQSCCWS